MKHKGRGKRKPSQSPLVGAEEGFQEVDSLNAQDDTVRDHYENPEFHSRKDPETPSNNTNETIKFKNARSLTNKLLKGSSSLSVNVKRKAELMQGDRTNRQNPELAHQDPLHNNEEIKCALEVMRKVMKMDAAQPFNVPVDPVALGIPDYLDVIDTPMDFGTICKNLENGVKYKNAKDVFYDVQFIWDNCSKYNKKGHYVLELMKRVKKNFAKYWTEAGLFMEQPEDYNGHSHLHPLESTVRCSTQRQRSPVAPMTEYPRYQHQDQMDPSQPQSYPPPQSCNIFHPPLQRPCQCHRTSCQQQIPYPHGGARFGCAGEGYSHLAPVHASIRQSPCGHRSEVGHNAEDRTHWWCHEGPSQSQCHEHQPSLSYGKPCQPQQGSYQWQPTAGPQLPSHLETGVCGASAESMLRRHPYEQGCPVDLMFDNPSHLQQNRTSVNPCQSRHKSFPCPPSFQQPLPSQADDVMDVSSSEHLSSPPHVGSMIRSSKRVPRSPEGPMTVTKNHQDQVASSQIIHPQPSSSYCQPCQPPRGTSQVQLSSSQTQPFHPQAGTDKEEHFCSTPPAKSMIRSSKRGPRCPIGPMNASDKHQDQVASTQIVHPQPSSSYGQPHQLLEGTSQVQDSSSQPQPSHPQAGTDGGVDSRRIKRARGRGRSRCLEVLNSKEKIPIASNELGQAIGSEAPKLTSFLGIIARDGTIAPLNYVDWRALPDGNKEKMWQKVLSKFDIDPESKTWVLKSIGKKWKDWKAELKASRYNTHETDEERLADRDERVLPDQWPILVSFWNSQEAKERSAINKASRAHQNTSHATGQKSFARVREEQRLKRPDGKEPTRAEVFILTRTRKDGRPVNEATSAVMSQLRERAAQQQETSQSCPVEDDAFTQVMGQDRHGYVRTYGLGPSPSDLGGPSRREAEAMRMVSNANAEVRDMREKMASMEQTCAQMATQMATMMSIMSDMQKKISEKDGSLSEPSQAVDVSIDSGGLPSSSIQGVASNQNQATRRGKTQSASASKVSWKKS